MWPWILLGGIPVGAVTALLTWGPLRRFGKGVQTERARELFLLQRERLEAKFVSAASASGKPRGLRWKDCDFESDIELARERATGQLVALVSVTVQVDAIPGRDMEYLPA